MAQKVVGKKEVKCVTIVHLKENKETQVTKHEPVVCQVN